MHHSLGLTTKERQRYSLTRLCVEMAAASEGGLRRFVGVTDESVVAAERLQSELEANVARRKNCFEFECSAELRRIFGVDPQRGGAFVPDDILYGKRDMVAADGPSGGYLKSPDVPRFAAAVREVSWLERVPVQRLVDLKNDQSLPRHGSNLSVTWLSGENAPASEQTPSFGVVALAPKTVAIVIERSRQHLIQAAGHDELLERELGLSLGVATATACAQGSGVDGQPTGALSQVSQSVSGTALSWTNTCEMVRLVEGAAAGEGIAALVGTTAAKTLRTREKATGNGFILSDGKIDTALAIPTVAMPADAILVGNFAHAVYANWAPIEIVATPLASATNFSRGIIAIRALASLDFGIVHALAFSKSTSIT